MARIWITINVILLFFIGLGALLYSSYASVSILPKLSDATENMENFHYDSIFRINEIYYHSGITENNTIENICDTKASHIIIVEGLFNTMKLPDQCELLCDNRFQKQFTPEEPHCTDCGNQMTLLIDISSQDTRIDHAITLCCDDICHEKKLLAKC